MSNPPDRPDTPLDYAALYDGYWQRPDRFGSHSFKDAGEIARQILTTCGPGKLLDVGSGMGLLVRELLQRGIDAYGIDPSRIAVDACNAQTPGRFSLGSILALPFPDGVFETVVSTDCLEHLAEPDIPIALKELARVCRGGLYLRIATRPDRDGIWHLTVKDRAWWEARLFETGLRKHPLYLRVTPYASLEDEGGNCTLVFERIPPQAQHRYPASWLAKNRDLHMDMLRESGRRSDAHVARYALAAEHVRPGDTVLDAACGMGYGAALLARGSQAARVIGVDNSEAAIAYARAAFSGQGVPTEFHRADVAELAFLPDESVDVVVSFETLEHVPDPPALLAEFRRVLTPGGRVIVSVPNDWADETGKDPNPNHLHVYTWPMLRAQLTASFIPEKRWRQVAGGARKLSDRPRSMEEVSLGVPIDAPPQPDAPHTEPEAEWWLALGMKSPIGASKANYRETVFPPYEGPDGESFHISAFARDYDNPWLFRSLICIGPRLSHDAQRERLAREVIATARPGSADHGGAVCVIAYSVLASPSPERVAEAFALIEAFDTAADDTPHSWRWRISNRFAAARLLLQRGERVAARDQFLRVAGMDVLRFSPLLATKTVDAFRLAGVLSAADGRTEEARESFRHGLDECRRVVQGSWVNVWGFPDRPQPYGMHEISQVMDLGSGCAAWLGVLDRLPLAAGQAWLLAQRQSFSDLLSWTQELNRSRRWLESQMLYWQTEAARRHSTAQELRTWSDELNRAREWLNDQLAQTRNQLAQHEREAAAALAQRHEAIVSANEQAVWLQGQVSNYHEAYQQGERANRELKMWIDELTATLAARDASLAEIKGWAASLEEGKRWLEQQYANTQAHADALAAAVTDLKAWTADLEKGKLWLEQHSANTQARADELAAVVAARESTVAELKSWITQLEEGKAWHEQRHATMAARAAELEGTLTLRDQALAAQGASLRDRNAEVERLRQRVEESDARAARLEVELRAAHDRSRRSIAALRSRGLWQRVRNTGFEPDPD